MLQCEIHLAQGPNLRELWRYFRCEICRYELKLKLLKVKSTKRF